MAILITGGAGYIGGHTAKYFSNAGLQPVVVDDLRTGHASAVRWGPFIHSDIADSDAIRGGIKEHSIDAVLHFAASCYVGESAAKPGLYFANNVTNTLKLLDAVCAAGIRYFVFSSSCATYGIPESLPVREDTPQQPINPYGESKLFVERALHWYEQAHGLKWVALRYFNAAGADPEGDLGERHDPETHLIPLAIQAALGQGPEVRIYGSDYATADGSAIRDYIHVSDLADAHFLALEYLRAGGSSTAFNIGAGQGFSVRQVIAAVEQITGRSVPAQVSARRRGDPPVLVADASRAREILQWTPRFSSLETIIATAHRWHSRAPVAAANQ